MGEDLSPNYHSSIAQLRVGAFLITSVMESFIAQDWAKESPTMYTIYVKFVQAFGKYKKLK
jgi:hypothetical protein